MANECKYVCRVDSEQTFGNWFRQQLERREWSQQDFSRKAKLSPSTVSDWARGQKIPDPSSIDVIADVFGIDVDEVLTRAGHRPQVEPFDPDDPKREFRAMISRLEMTEEKEVALRALLRAWLTADAHARQAKEDQGK